ncbi:MAG: sulfatase-like hydrolase/transferase, partial [Opitutae bacterium]|nr:sulfatase-like hydrolase/transferase [Opitutae bacterium]
KKQGFDEFFGIRDGFIDNYNHYFLHGNGFHDLYEGITPVESNGKYFPEMMTHRCLEFIEENKDRPFFLYAPFNIPHYPEQAPRKFAEPFMDMKDAARRSYATIMNATDYYIGEIVSKLETLKLRENTIIIFMSDNGHSEETGNRIRVDNHKSGYPKGHFYGASGGGSTGKWIGRKGTFLEGGVRVPAIISYPSRLPKGEVRGQVITAMDWFPTILGLCGVLQPEDAPKLDGHDILPLIKNPDASSLHEVLHFAWGRSWAVRQGEWKLINGKSLHKLFGEKPEVKNYYNEKPLIVDRLKALHSSWIKKVSPK